MQGIAVKRMATILCALFVMCVFGENVSIAEKVKLAQDGNAEAQFQLGVCYLEGNGVDKDADEAKKWFRKWANAVTVESYRAVAEQEDADAQFSLGWHYANGKGVAKNEAEAV